LRVLVSDTVSGDAIKLLESSGVEFEYKPDISPQALLSTIVEFDALIVRSRTKVTKDVISAAPKMKVIGRAGVGVDNIDLEAAKARKITILNTPNALTNAVAEFTLGLMIGLARKIPTADASTKGGKWEKSKFLGTELKGKTYGTIGIGKIGQRVAELASAFGMKIIANDVIPISEELVKRLDIHVSTQQEVFSLSDFVDIHVPLTPETENLANYDKLRTMKKSAFLINTSRGRVVNEKDLYRALNEKIIAGAALDVYDVEPPTSLDLLKLDNVIATPHVAGQTAEAQSMAGVQIVELVLKALNSP
jgi:D-3-phosphoglycerate dehydrogenase / 2-oxoglutarate reductase